MQPTRGSHTLRDVIDGHNDLPWAMRVLCEYDLDAVDLSSYVPSLQTDIPRLREGEVTGQFWSVYVPSTLPGGESVTQTLEQIDFVYRMVDRYPNDFALAFSANEIEAARKQGYIASLIGMEGGHSINESLAVLRMMHDLGARYMTLTHNHNTPWADSATDDPVHHGMSPFGGDVIREMNRLGMLVDLSHVSADVMRQAIAISSSPVMFSHSSARAVCDVSRNVPDDVLETIPGNGGICMVTFVSGFVSPSFARWVAESKEIVQERGGDPRNLSAVDQVMRQRAADSPPAAATIDDVVLHLEHIRETSGIEHVGIGGDFDGSTFMPAELEDVSGYPRLFAALAERSWSQADLEALQVGNVMRVIRDAEVSACSSVGGVANGH
jgi:membrane dipeptidase